MIKICPSCKKESDKNEKYCSFCGVPYIPRKKETVQKVVDSTDATKILQKYSDITNKGRTIEKEDETVVDIKNNK